MTSLLRPQSRPLQQCHRTFSTTIPRAVSLQWEKNDPEAIGDAVPLYPYGPTRWYKQSRLGLYGGQRIQFGNNVGKDSEVKTRRKWHVNVFTRKLLSKSLDRTVQVRVSARTLRTIDKLGGLDEYLLGEKEARIKALGESGWWLRWAIMQTPAIKKRFAEERTRLGLPQTATNKELDESIDTQPVVEEATEEEVKEAMENGEHVTADDAFQVEATPSRPPLKFRVGPKKHIILTADGWRRTRPDRSRKLTGLIQSKLEGELLESKTRNFELRLRRVQKLMPGPQRLKRDEEAEVIRSARREYRKELGERAEKAYVRRETKKADEAKRRRAEKAQKTLVSQPAEVETE